MRIVFALSLACVAVALALAAYCVTRIPIYKHVTRDVLANIDRTYIDRTSLDAAQVKQLDRQFQIVMYNEKVKEEAWSALWSVAPLGFVVLALANAALALFSVRASRSRGVTVKPDA